MRVVKGASIAVASPVFLGADGETPTDATGTPTVAAVDISGTTLTAPSVASVAGRAGCYTATLTAAAHTANLGRLTLTWTATVSGATQTLTDYVDVVGAHYATIPELRAIKGLAESDGVSTAELMARRDEFAGIIEQARGVSYVPQAAVFVAEGGDEVIVPHMACTGLVSVTADTTDVTSQCRMETWGLVSTAYPFMPPLVDDRPNVTVIYTHGHQSPPPAVREACREYVRSAVVRSRSGQRDVIAQTAEGMTLRYSTPDWSADRWTGFVEVDRLIGSLPDERVPGMA